MACTGCFEDQALPGDGTGDDAATTGDTTSMATGGTPGPSSTATDSTPTDSTPTDTTPTDTTPTDGGGECRDGEVCLEAVEAGWEGPLAIQMITNAEPPLPCPTGWETRPSLFADLEVSPFSCACHCPGPATPMCQYTVTFRAGSQCDGALLESETIELGGCATHLIVGAHSVQVQDVASVADCGPPTWDPPAPSSWATRVDVCVPAVGSDCSLGTCVPAPLPPHDGALCIVAEGDVPCPEDSVFEVRHVAYAAFDDQRICECGCFPTDAWCGGTLVAYSDTACGGNSVGTTSVVEGCVPNLDLVSSADVGSAIPTATCQPVSPGEPSGEVTAAGPSTFCCTQP